MMTVARNRLACCLLLACSALAGCSSDSNTPSDQSDDPATNGDDKVDASKPPSKLDAGGTKPPGTGPGSTVKMDAASTPPVVKSDAGAPSTEDPPADDAGSTGTGSTTPPPSVFPAVADPTAAGPYKTKTVNMTGPNSKYTIYQPDPLGADGVKHPVLTWGSGGNTTPSAYPMLPHLASHGFVVIGTNTRPQIDMEVPLSDEMVKGVDWLLEENAKSGSDYFGKLDPNHVAPFGYSMGGLASFVIVGDPRFTTSVHMSGGNMGKGPERIGKAHAPMFWECGTGDIAGPNCDDDFAALTTQTVFYGTLQGADHLGIMTAPYATKITAAVTAWFRYFLMADQSYKPWFYGADCMLCTKTADWKVEKKNFD